jgi:hypothetical protein
LTAVAAVATLAVLISGKSFKSLAEAMDARIDTARITMMFFISFSERGDHLPARDFAYRQT